MAHAETPLTGKACSRVRRTVVVKAVNNTGEVNRGKTLDDLPHVSMLLSADDMMSNVYLQQDTVHSHQVPGSRVYYVVCHPSSLCGLPPSHLHDDGGEYHCCGCRTGERVLSWG